MEKIEGPMMRRVPDIVVPPHINPETEIIHVRCGSLQVIYDGIKIQLSQGQLLMILPYRMHSFLPSEDIDASVYMFSDEIYDDLMKNIRNAVYYPAQDNPVLNGYVNDIMEYADRWNGNLGIRSMFCALVNQCMSVYDADMPEVQPELLDGRTVSYIIDHLNEELTIESIARELGVNVRQLSTDFRKKYGLKLVEFIGNIRAEQADTMLKHSKLRISEIAGICGYGSLRNFNRSFRERFQMSPRDFRQQNEDRHG